MSKSIKVTPKKRGRPATGKDPLVTFRLPPETIKAVEDWKKRTGAVSRSSAYRALIELGLKRS